MRCKKRRGTRQSAYKSAPKAAPLLFMAKTQPQELPPPEPLPGARLIKQSPQAVVIEVEPAPVASHPDRALWDELIGLRWAELRAIYRRVLGHPPKCKNCGHNL